MLFNFLYKFEFILESKLHKKVLFALIILCNCSFLSFAQDEEEVAPIYLPSDSIDIKDYVPDDKRNLSRIGIIGNSNFNLHSSSFKELDPSKFTNCCTEFKSGYGLGVNLGIFYNHQINDLITFEYSLGLNYFDATLKENEFKQIEIDQTLQDAEILHQLETSLRYLEFNYKIKMELIQNSRILGGLFASVPLISEMNHFEKLVKPNNRGTFEDGRRIRNEYNGNIPNTNSLLFGFTVGIEHDFYLNKKKTYAITPQFIIGQSLNSFINNKQWVVTFFRFGFAFSYNTYNDFDSPLSPTK